MNASANSLPVAVASQALAVASVATEGAMTKAQIVANRALLLDVMGSQMKRGQHYGVIKGTPKPTLFKAGAELLLMLFRIDAVPSVEDLSNSDCIRYRVILRGVHVPSGLGVGHGVGEASTDEEKYKWKKTNSRREFENTPEDRRRVKYYWDSERREEYEVIQVRTNPADAANTILKMAKKRAQVDLALSCTAASDVFTQDLEDLEQELRESIIEGEATAVDDNGDNGEPDPPRRQQSRGKPTTQAPKATSNGNGRCTERQAGMLRKKLDDSGIPENDFFTKFGVPSIEELPFAKVDEALSWIKSTGA